jgi:hypothetical protein
MANANGFLDSYQRVSRAAECGQGDAKVDERVS